MPWYEYLLKCYSYSRQSKDDLRKVRFLAYHSHIASSIKLTRIPTIDQFFPIKGDKTAKTVSESAKERHLAQYKSYLDIKEGKNGV
jgi:hypothetical protein